MAIPAAAQGIYTTMAAGTTVNGNIYPAKSDVYLSGGPQNCVGNGLPDGTYYFQVTDPSASVLLSSDGLVDRTVQVVTGMAPESRGLSARSAGGRHRPRLRRPFSVPRAR